MAKTHPTAKRIVAATSVAGILITASVALVGGPAQAKEVVDCSAYDFSCDKNGYASEAYRSYWTMAAGHNCTNYVAWRMIQDGMTARVTWLHNGGQWAADARKKGVPVDGNPHVGDAAQWYGGSPNVSSSGRVAYIEEVTEKSITVAEDNYSSGPLRIRTIFRGDDHWPSNFIHLNDSAPDPPPAPEPAPAPPPSVPSRPKLKDVTRRWLPDLKSLNIYG